MAWNETIEFAREFRRDTRLKRFSSLLAPLIGTKRFSEPRSDERFVERGYRDAYKILATEELHERVLSDSHSTCNEILEISAADSAGGCEWRFYAPARQHLQFFGQHSS
jgi:hypothetical protein